MHSSLATINFACFHRPDLPSLNRKMWETPRNWDPDVSMYKFFPMFVLDKKAAL